MNAAAQKLIRLLEQECRNLRRFIAAALKEEHYNLAHAHNRALYRAQHRLRVVRNLEDQHADRREYLKHVVSRYPQDLIDGIEGYEFEFARKNIAELNDLERQAPVPAREGNQIDTLLRLVVDGSMKGINIVLSKRDGLVLQIRHQKECVKITIPELVRLTASGVFVTDKVRTLMAMGFVLKSEERLEMQILVNGEAHAKAMTVISRIAFDVFYFRGFAGQSYMEVLGKRRN